MQTETENQTGSTTELALVTQWPETKDGLRAIINDIKQKVKSLVLDPTTEKGRAEIKSVAYNVARTKTTLDDLAKQAIEHHQSIVKATNEQRRQLREELDALKEEVRQPVTEYENREKERVRTRTEAIDSIDGLVLRIHNATTPDEVKEVTLPESFATMDWMEFEAIAKPKIAEFEHIKADRLARLIKAEQERKELEELRRKQAEEEQRKREAEIAKKAAKEAEERARRQAEEKAKAEQEAREKKEREERERIEAERRKEREEAEAKVKAAEEARLKAEQEAKAKEDARIKAEAEAKAEEERRAKDKANRKAKCREAAESLKSATGIDEETAVKVVKSIVDGKITNVSIKF